MEASNYHVVFSSNGKEGLSKVAEEKPDLILLDVMMPEMDGLTFARELQKKEIFRSIPILILTAKSELGRLIDLEGVCDYVTKPFQTEELITKIQKYINN